MKKYLRTDKAADYLGTSKSFLEKARLDGTGPKFLRLGSRMVSYSIEDLDEWAVQNSRFSTSEAA